MQGDTSETPVASVPLKGIVVDIALNATVPLVLYRLAKQFVTASELHALLVATCFPIAKSIFDLRHRKQLDPVAILVLLGIITSILAIALGGSPRLLLIRESFFTGTVGVACLVSLLPVFSRPMMFYFGRYFMTQNDPLRRAQFDASWQYPRVRSAHRLITLVWGVVFLVEFIFRIILVYVLSTPLFLFLAPIVQGSLIVATIIWTFRYAREVRKKGASDSATHPVTPGG